MIHIIEFVVAVVATLSFAILFSAPRSELIYCGITGGLGWIIYYEMTEVGCGVVLASAIATFFLTILARAFAVVRCNPVTVYLLTGIFPLVPGAGIFYTVYYLILDNQPMASDKGLQTFEIAAAIVIGIIFGFAIPQSLFRKLSIFNKRR